MGSGLPGFVGEFLHVYPAESGFVSLERVQCASCERSRSMPRLISPMTTTLKNSSSSATDENQASTLALHLDPF